jgi:hypothetical protein
MSTYDDASLVLIPSGYKNGIVFSQKPMDANGQLTFTRASSATRVASNGLIEKVRTNILLHSEAFDNAVYNKGTGGSVVANTVVAPDGTMTADAYTWATSTTTYAFLSQTVSGTSQIPNTFSIYIKRPAGSGSRTLRLAVSDVAISTSSSSTFTITESWQRFQFTRTSASTTGSVGVGFFLGASGVSIAAGEVLDVWGAQLETGDIATDYIATTTAAVSVGPVSGLPRLDYLGSTCPRLLLEPQRTNLAQYSEQFDNAGWGKTGLGVTANNSTSPDGNTNADKLFNSVGTNGFASQTISLVSSTIYSGSVFAKNAGRDSFFVLFSGSGGSASCTFDLTTLTTTPSGGVTAKIEDYGGGWYRCSVVFTATSTGATAFRIYPSLTTGDGTSGIFVWGAQLEAGAYASSYIPTLGASVTRVAENCSKTGISSLIGQQEGVVFVDFVYNASANEAGNLFNNSLSTTASVFINRTAAGLAECGVFVSGTARPNLIGGSIPLGSRVKLAFAYKSGSSAFYINGLQIATSSNAFTIPAALTEINLNDDSTYFAYQQSVSFNQVLLFKTRLTNESLASLTSL